MKTKILTGFAVLCFAVGLLAAVTGNVLDALVGSGLTLAVETKSANYTLTDTDFTVIATGSNPLTFTLPDATAHKGRVYVIKTTTAFIDRLIVEPSVEGQMEPAQLSLGRNIVYRLQSTGLVWIQI